MEWKGREYKESISDFRVLAINVRRKSKEVTHRPIKPQSTIRTATERISYWSKGCPSIRNVINLGHLFSEDADFM